MQQMRQNITTGVRPTLKISPKTSQAPSQQLGDILQDSANDISKKLIDTTMPENLRQPLNDVREQTMNSIKNFREQRQLNQKPPVNDVTMNQVKKKTGIWGKVKNGLSKFWQFSRKPIQSLIGMIPYAGGLINQGIDMFSGDKKLK
ncbi:Hypothetical_protein [Hexamita inflata]|uniref:Hypothetical_protein n=1 Tax=Hexamita inflata TaxID=28002 RepID=A0AA86V6D4_9EUKA|nr:Hypothetical protein HINF_LOCUS65821 [Hexamita inflata]